MDPRDVALACADKGASLSNSGLNVRHGSLAISGLSFGKKMRGATPLSLSTSAFR